jgi:hypothetical protein
LHHKTYDPSLDTQSLGKRFYKGVYDLNEPKHVSENLANQGEPKNFYAML